MEEKLTGMRSIFYRPSVKEIETRRRIRLSLAAYQYEFLTEYTPLMTDNEFDQESLKVDLKIETGRPQLNTWWKENFKPYTGSWITKHPEKDKLERICNALEVDTR